jgi:hypothetical protein
LAAITWELRILNLFTLTALIPTLTPLIPKAIVVCCYHKLIFRFKVQRCRWAFISFAWPKETEPKKKPPLSPDFQKINYVVAWAKTRYAQTLAHLIHQIV